MQPKANRRLSVAPMMDWTDRHCRFFLRLISRRALLYTEMVPTGAIVHGDRARFLAFHPAERPLALQLGGAEPVQLAECAEAAAAAGYDEVNLNVGCPSDRVQHARFGACLMAEPELVGRCVAAMAAASALPVTVKTRTGIDERDSYAELKGFVETVAAECDIEIQRAVRRTGGTDAGEIHRSRDGVPTVVLGVPARYIHSHVSLLHWQDYLAARKLVLELVLRLDGPRTEELTCFE